MQPAASVFAIVMLMGTVSATAAPAPARPAPRTCRPEGSVLFEIDHRVDPKIAPSARVGTATVRVFANGGWTRDAVDADGVALAPSAGCLARAELAELEATLQGATWKTTMARMRCMAVSPAYTVYRVRGTAVYTQRLCGGQRLDDRSRAKLDAAVALVERATTKPGP